jgi:hypothetical protein
MTDLFFCNICQESIPQIQFDSEEAFRDGSRCICKDCAILIARPASSSVKKARWIWPLVTFLFLATWSLFGYFLLELGEGVISGNKSRQLLWGEVEELSENLILFDANLRSQIKQSEGQALMVLDGLSRSLEAVNQELRDALNRQALELRELEGIPGSLELINKKFDLSTSEFVQFADSISDLKNRLQILEDSFSGLERTVTAAKPPQSVEEGSFSKSVQKLLEDLGSEDPMDRFDALEKIINYQDPNLVPYVTPLLLDTYEMCRFQAAFILRSWSALSAVPKLIDALDDNFSYVRKEVNDALEAITKISVDYDHRADEALRAQAVARWRDWANKNGF